MAHMTQITPFVPCRDLDVSLAFYRDILGFEVGFLTEGVYAFVRRDQVAVRLLQVSPDVDLTSEERQNSFYIDTDHVDELFGELQPALSRLPDARVRAPFDQDYGQREFHAADPDCTLVFFGAAIRNH
ncbi:MAG: VOC family protein [Pseudomonadota bacterium]